jgi:cell wall assembly regulator SMI1
MQKFTRALTREIEVGGQRLAVTFDEKGLKIRRIGSRERPCEASWDAVLCALIGRTDDEPSADEVRAALEALRSGSTAQPAVKPLAGLDEAAGVTEVLARLDDWLKQHRKRYHNGLMPGASDRELARLATALRRPVPDELAAWLRWHNGQSEELIGTFVESFNLMSVADIIETLKDRKGQEGWDPAFIPILDDYQDDLVVLDTSKPGLPVREVWRGRSDHPEVATSMRGWLESLLADFQSWRYHEDSERGEYMREGS